MSRKQKNDEQQPEHDPDRVASADDVGQLGEVGDAGEVGTNAAGHDPAALSAARKRAAKKPRKRTR